MSRGHLIFDDVAGNVSVTVHDVQPVVPGLPFPVRCVPIFTDVLEQAAAEQLRDYLIHVLGMPVPKRIRIRRDRAYPNAVWWTATCPEHPDGWLVPGVPRDAWPTHAAALRAAERHLAARHQENPS